METLDAIKDRRTIRRFSDKKIDENILKKILDAGRLAPSTGNIPSVRYLVVESEASKKVVADVAKLLLLPL